MISTDWFSETEERGQGAEEWRIEESLLGGSEAPSPQKPRGRVGQEGSVCPHRLERQPGPAYVKASAFKLAPATVVGQDHAHMLLSPRRAILALRCWLLPRSR